MRGSPDATAASRDDRRTDAPVPDRGGGSTRGARSRRRGRSRGRSRHGHVSGARGGSRDIDAVFAMEAEAIGRAAREVAEAHGLLDVWLNDHVRVFVAPDAPTVDFFEVPGLRVRMVRLDYLFYMNAWSGDPIDQRDLRVIANALGLKDEREANAIVRGLLARRAAA